MKEEINVSRPPDVRPAKRLVPRRPLVLAVAREHALDAHADTLDVVDGRPALPVQQVEADDAVAVDVGMGGNGPWGIVDAGECYFGCFCVLSPG